MSTTPPDIDPNKVNLFSIALQLAVLTEKVNTLEKKVNGSGSKTLAVLALLVSALIFLLNLGGKLSWT